MSRLAEEVRALLGQLGGSGRALAWAVPIIELRQSVESADVSIGIAEHQIAHHRAELAEAEARLVERREQRAKDEHALLQAMAAARAASIGIALAKRHDRNTLTLNEMEIDEHATTESN